MRRYGRCVDVALLMLVRVFDEECLIYCRFMAGSVGSPACLADIYYRRWPEVVGHHVTNDVVFTERRADSVWALVYRSLKWRGPVGLRCYFCHYFADPEVLYARQLGSVIKRGQGTSCCSASRGPGCVILTHLITSLDRLLHLVSRQEIDSPLPRFIISPLPDLQPLLFLLWSRTCLWTMGMFCVVNRLKMLC